VLFQLDSTDSSKNQVLRGNEMTKYREQALEHLEKYGVQTSILMTVIRGLNDDEIGSILRFTLSKPFLRGFEVQTMSYTGSGGRMMKFDPMDRITGTDLIHSIENQSDGLVRIADFSPMAHPHPNCVAITYVLMLLDGTSIPFPRFTDPEVYAAAVRNAFIAKPDERHERLLKEIIDGVFAREAELEKGPMILATLKAMLEELYPASGCIDDTARLRLVEKYVKNVFLHNYMDDHSFDASVLRKCTSMQIIPDGRMIPNCGYRVIHRKSDPRWQTSKQNIGHGVDGLRKRLQVVMD
jgi:7,8-dihydro-6-hydroxymethylpterin dimethyltransferase